MRAVSLASTQKEFQISTVSQEEASLKYIYERALSLLPQVNGHRDNMTRKKAGFLAVT